MVIFMKTGANATQTAAKRKRDEVPQAQEHESLAKRSLKERFYHLTAAQLNDLARGEVPQIVFQEGTNYLVIPDLYKGRILPNFSNAMKCLKSFVKINNIAGVLVTPNIIRQEHDLQIYEDFLEAKVGIYHDELENPYLPIPVRFSQTYNACLMDPLVVEREIITKAQNPSLIHEGPTYNCGLASVLMTLATHDKPKFMRFARQIAIDGECGDYTVTASDLRPRDNVDPRKKRTVIEMFINALNNTDTYISEKALPIANFFENFKKMLLERFGGNVHFKNFIEKFFEGRLRSFVANTPKIIVALLERLGFVVLRERINYSLLQNFPKEMQENVEPILYSEDHKPFAYESLLEDLNHIHDMLEQGHTVISSLNIDYNFKLIKSEMSDELIKMDPKLRPDHMVFTTKLNLTQDEAGRWVDFGFHTFGEHYDVHVDLDDFAQGYRGYISAKNQ